MKLPALEQAYVPETKVVKYLLNLYHAGGGEDKARFFMSFGFTIEQWDRLAQSLLAHAAANDVVSTVETTQGVNFAIDGLLDTPDGRRPRVRSIWTLDTESSAPRFVTAYPVRSGGDS